MVSLDCIDWASATCVSRFRIPMILRVARLDLEI